MQLTKTQVIALFLGVASAQTDAEVINGPYTNIDGSSKAIKENSMKECNGNNDCDAEDNKCANYQKGDTTDDIGEATKNYCINEKNCGAMGKIGGVHWSLQCWEDAADNEVASQPAKVNNKEIFDALKGLLTPVPEEDELANGEYGDSYNWLGYPVWDKTDNLWVSPRFNYQDGWYTTTDATKAASWKEWDKKVYNQCANDIQCATDLQDQPTGDCCLTWPDANNTKCGKATLAKKAMSVGPIKDFIPTCQADWNAEQDEEVGNAGDTIAEKALAEANEALKSFFKAQEEDAQTNAGYDKMSEKEKEDFDKERKSVEEEREKLITSFKTAAGIEGNDKCGTDCQADYEENLMKWFKDVYELCKTNSSSIECREANKLRLKEEEARAAGDKNYYIDMTEDDIKEFAKNWDEESQKEASSLAAAWIKNNAPKDGDVGSACNAETIPAKCTTPTHCCGTATPKEGAFVKEKLTICQVRTAVTFDDQLGEKFTFKCQELAKTIAATAATAGALAYSLM